MQPRGWLIIGSVDPSFYTGTISWCPRLEPPRWIVNLDRIATNGTTVFTNQKALIDTGTAYIVASPSAYNSVQQHISGARPIPEKGGLYFTYPKDSLRSVSFTFGARELNLWPQDFNLGRIQVKDGATVRVCSSIIRLANWDFDDDL